eukprot:CAMPEP_0198529654 /NCGR_PEP_ID=MMETSP1462-20131121/25880_1 /TAXON_ID=1333877 /ORGANISM="Brandtodinium nutriculum, Strain RCC3387" /LENGTH=36 /DNA_ID= /DNA_START= /DNA_END= /DNA_ORIENTATION=
MAQGGASEDASDGAGEGSRGIPERRQGSAALRGSSP